MKKVMQFFPVIAAIMLATGCGGGSMSSAGPKEVLAEFFKRLGEKDIEGATKLATKDSKSTMDMMKKGLDLAENMKDQMPDKEKDMTEEFKDVEMGEPKIDGDAATVPFKNIKKNVSFDFPLKKESGSWKVDFSMATLMKMGMEGQKNGMMDGENGMEDLKNVDPEDVQKGLQMLDTAVNKLDPEKLKALQEELKKLQQNQ